MFETWGTVLSIAQVSQLPVPVSVETVCCSQQSALSAAGTGCSIFTCMDPGLCDPFLQKDRLGATLEEENGTSFLESSEVSAGHL